MEAHIAKEIGPRVVGGIYRTPYGGYEYEVLHIGTGKESRIPWAQWSITVRVASDSVKSVRTHCTSWDDREAVISQPS